jgi:hypothetical protein
MLNLKWFILFDHILKNKIKLDWIVFGHALLKEICEIPISE